MTVTAPPEPTTLETSRHGRVVEPRATRSGAGMGRFVAGALVAYAGALAAVLALNIVVDPFALAGTHIVPSAVETDRAIKLTLLGRLRRSPEILILGSSRARVAEPSYLHTLTGHTGFNAGVTGGTAADAYVFTRYAADRFRGHERRYIWFVDAGVATNGINPQLQEDPRARPYLPGGRRFGLADIGTYLSPQATSASVRVVRKCVVAQCRARIAYNPDGSIRHRSMRYLPEHTTKLHAAIQKLIASIRAHPPVARPVDPKRYVYFERALAFMNARGERPVIVLNPLHPSVLRELERYGFPARRRALAYFKSLHHRFDFVLVDAEDIRTWGGSPNNFLNPSHVDWRNMRLLLKYVVARSGTALK